MVENSIISRNVFVGEGSYIKNSIILSSCCVGINCRIENAILDKFVNISNGKVIVGYDNPRIIEKKMVI